jgi:ribosomal subunit interface protein
MTIRVSGKSITVGEALRERVSDRTDEVLSKYFEGNYSGHVTIGKDKAGFRTDCALHLDSGMTLEAEATADDAYASADQAIGMIERRLKRYKSRLKDRSPRKNAVATAHLATFDVASYVIEAPGLDDDAEITAFNPVVIAESTTSLKNLSVSEAVMELDLTGAPVVLFLHGTSGRLNVVYRRPDGNVGWVDPPQMNG